MDLDNPILLKKSSNEEQEEMALFKHISNSHYDPESPDTKMRRNSHNDTYEELDDLRRGRFFSQEDELYEEEKKAPTIEEEKHLDNEWLFEEQFSGMKFRNQDYLDDWKCDSSSVRFVQTPE